MCGSTATVQAGKVANLTQCAGSAFERTRLLPGGDRTGWGQRTRSSTSRPRKAALGGLIFARAHIRASHTTPRIALAKMMASVSDNICALLASS